MSVTKKIFLTSSALLAIVLVFWGIYNLSFSSKIPLTATPNPITAPASPTAPVAKINLVSEDSVLSPIIDPATATIKYYSQATGQVFQVDFDGTNKKTLSPNKLADLNNVFWSADGTKVISKFIKDGAPTFFHYDYTTKKGVKLKDNLDTVVWQNNNKIFYKYYNPQTKERSLNMANPDGSGWLKISDLPYKNLSIAPIPRTGLVSYWNSPDAFFETTLESTPVIGGEKKLIFKGKFGADYLWNSNGSNVLISHSDQKNGSQMELAVINDAGGEYKNLAIQTFISKCAWSKDNKTFYYALPSSFPSSLILPNDYQEKKFATRDSFWRVNIPTGEKTRLLGLDKITDDFDATGLFLNADESMLFFSNRTDGKLYRIDL